MDVSKLKKNECGKVISISSDTVLRSRLNSFGIIKGATIYVIEQTISKNTIEIRVNSTKIALRTSEAQTIEVEKIPCKI